MDRRDLNHCLAGLGPGFVIPAQPPIPLSHDSDRSTTYRRGSNCQPSTHSFRFTSFDTPPHGPYSQRRNCPA